MTVTLRRACPVIITLYLALTLAGCATTTANLPPEVPAMHTVSEVDDQTVEFVEGDPWTGFNHHMYNFNYRFDKYFFIPVVDTYEFITPNFVQTGVSNFYNNINEFRTLYNSLLQAKGKVALITFGRFVTNSTIGVAGLFDPATPMGMKRHEEDFGHTLGVWGVSPGPYLVLPVLGPGTCRSATGVVVDSGIHYAMKQLIGMDRNVDHGNAIVNGLTILKVIDNRHQQPFRYYDSGYPFEYEMVKFLYRQKREINVMK